MTSRYDSYISMYGAEDFAQIQLSKVLLVGAGGIGCEILKNLVLCGFIDIEVIDLDTIDVSNLNRQFLFRSEHVGKPKSVVAAEAAMSFNPDAKVKAHHGNIKDKSYSVSYFEKFAIVLNALDNVDARKHVNRLCLAANVPLIDSGTTGYLGQVMPIFKGKTACYECKPKQAQKVYPICTIRSTPDKPVHCIVWAKELFKLVCGQATESMLYEEENEDSSSTYMKYATAFHDTSFPDASQDAEIMNLSQNLLTALFSTEIAKCIEGKVYEKAKTQPVPISAESIMQAAAVALSVLEKTGGSVHSAGHFDDRAVLDLQQTVTELLLCMREASKESPKMLQFDKDDSLAMRFVAAASNLRSLVFGIQQQNFHDAKGVAGNIIPAIATTNAIVAGIQVFQAIKVIRAMRGSHPECAFEKCSHVYVNRMPNRKGTFLQPTLPEDPDSRCYVCNSSQVELSVDTTVTTLGQVVSKVIKSQLGFNCPSVSRGSSGLYEEGDDADDSLVDNLDKILAECCGGILDGTILTIEDFTQDLEVSLLVRHVSTAALSAMGESVEAAGFLLGGLGELDKQKEKQEKQQETLVEAQSSSSSVAAGVDSDEVMILDDPPTAALVAGQKRQRDEEWGDGEKRLKQDTQTVFVLDD